MAATYTATGTISNLTRVELEQLRKADFFSNSKALTIGDSGLLPEGVVGRGDVNAEPYFTGPNLKLDDVYSADLPTQPGPGLTTLSSVGGMISETTRWYGPTYVFDSTVGFGSGTFQWTDNTPALNFTLFVQPGDLLLIKQPTGIDTGDDNRNTVGTVLSVTANQINLVTTSVVNPDLNSTQLDFGGNTQYGYVIVRPQAVQLFAVPGSGPGGREQTFLAVIPTSSLHSNLAPSIDQINADRIRNLVPPSYALDSSVDRADSVFSSPAPRTSLDKLGYRVILYRDDGTGLAPNLNAPLAALNPVIDSTIPAADQRMTFDFKAGILRFSCAPRLGDDIKVAGGVNPTSGRLSLYAVFWAVDTSLTAGSARNLHAVRSTDQRPFTPGIIAYDQFANVWRIGATTDQNELIIDARGNSEVPGVVTSFGVNDVTNSVQDPRKTFVYRRTINPGDPQIGFGWRSKEFARLTGLDIDPDVNLETRISDKQSWSVGDSTGPSQNLGADFNTEPYLFGKYGTRWATQSSVLSNAALAAAESGYGVVHLRRGTYQLIAPVVVPPGVEIRGEGSATIVKSSPHSATDQTTFVFGPNNQYGSYDFDVAAGGSFTPTTFLWSGSLEGHDIVWNAARRVWGIVQADLVTNEIWFNEVNTKGEALYPGVGIGIKLNVNILFSSASVNSQHHTGSHYPRIAHHNPTDEYSVVWVEEGGGPIGPRVQYQGLKHDPTTGAYIRKFTPNALFIGTAAYSDHPSIAVDTRNFIPANYEVAVSFFSYDDPVLLATPEHTALIINNATGATNVNGTTSMLAKQVVSSTDVDTDDCGNFLFAYSLRSHPIYYQVTGASTSGLGLITDASPPATSFVTAGVKVGSRYVQLWKTGNTDSGRSGVLQTVGAGALAVRFDDFDNGKFRNTAGSLPYAIVPGSSIHTKNYTLLGGFLGDRQIAGGIELTSTLYQMTEREPDFVRVKSGNGQYIVIYQAFDSNGYLSQESIQGFNPSTTFFSRSMVVQRQHLATCYAIVSQDGLLVGPSEQPPEFAPASEFLYASMAHPVTMRSMGGRSLNLPNSNLMGGWSFPGFINESRLEMEISARNYCIPWTATVPSSFIPDVTWSGSDWVIVSPCVSRITSDTGTYRLSGPTNLLEDPSFYFFDLGGGDPNTVNPGTDQIYFHATAETILITGVSSEHGVTLASAPSFANPTHSISWTLIRNPDFNGVYGTSGGMKNTGYRVNATGELVIGSEFFTFADNPDDGNTSLRRVQEILDRNLWGDATFTGDVGTGQFSNPLTRFGSAFNNWNDACPTSKIAADIYYRGVTVGGSKCASWEFLNEKPMVSIAWGENFYGYLDRMIHTSGHRTALFRQSFGPWNSGLKDMAIVGASSASNPTTRGLQVITKEHAFTRHGYSTTGQPHFATDGFRNVFSFVGMQYLQASYPYFDQAPLGDLREEAAYFKNLNTVHTDATGKDPIFHRGPPILFGADSPREFVDNLGSTGSTLVLGNGIKRIGSAAPKVIWNGKNFVSFYSVMVPTVIPPGMPQPFTSTSAAGGTEAGPQLRFWPKYRSIINMVNLHGDENLNNMNDALLANAQTQASIAFQDLSANSPKIVASSIISCGAYGDWELREASILDVAYSGKVYCVVWAMGFNTSPPTSGLPRLGGSVIGYSLFPDIEGANDALFSQGPTGVPSYTIETDDFFSPGNRVMEKARFLNPKVIWNGKKFLISFQFIDDNLGVQANAKYLRAIAVGEDGPGAKTQVKAMSANTRYSNSFSTAGIRSNGNPAFIGTLQPAGFGGDLGIILRSSSFDVPFSNITVMPGDTVEITGIVPGAEGAVANTEYNGFYPVQDWAMVDATTMLLDIGNNFSRMAPSFGDALPAFVHGRIHTGGFAGNTLEGTDGSASTGVNTKSYFLIPDSTVDSSITMSAYITRYHGVAYNPQKEEYVFLTEVQLTGATDRRLRLFLVKASTMTVTKEKDVVAPDGVGDFFPAALGWNGTQYLVVYKVPDTGNTWNLWYAVVSANLTIESQAVFANTNDMISMSGSGAKTMPGTDYQFVDFTKSLRPVMDSLHIEWNDRLSRWVISGSAITGGLDTTPYSARYNEKSLAFRETNNITSWTGTAVTLTGASALPQSGQRIVFSREEDAEAGVGFVSPNNYGSSGTDILNGDINASTTTVVVTSGTTLPTYVPYLMSLSAPTEIVRVTNVAGTTLTVVRGQFDTAAVPHANGITVAAIPDGVSIVDSTLVFSPIYQAGDQVQLTSNLQKPRRVVSMQTGRIVTEGSLLDPTLADFPSTANTYKVFRRGREVILESAALVDGTWTGTTLTSTVPTDFIAAGVRPGMEIVVYDAALANGTHRAEIISIGGAGNKVITFAPAISPIPLATSPYWIRKQANIIANITSQTGSAFVIDVSSTDRQDAAFFSNAPSGPRNAVDKIYYLTREDVFVWTLGYNALAVKVKDADSVYLDNVDIGGYVDIEERYYHMARPTRRSGGSVYGAPGIASVNSRSPTDYVFLSPKNKVDTLRLTNVRSKTTIQHGDTPRRIKAR